MSQFLLLHSNCRVISCDINNMRAWIHPDMLPSFKLLLVVLWTSYSCPIFGPYVPVQHCLTSKAYLSIDTEHINPFITTVFLSSEFHIQQDNAPSHKSSNPLKLVSTTLQFRQTVDKFLQQKSWPFLDLYNHTLQTQLAGLMWVRLTKTTSVSSATTGIRGRASSATAAPLKCCNKNLVLILVMKWDTPVWNW